jgi:hypothetical protein
VQTPARAERCCLRVVRGRRRRRAEHWGAAERPQRVLMLQGRGGEQWGSELARALQAALAGTPGKGAPCLHTATVAPKVLTPWVEAAGCNSTNWGWTRGWGWYQRLGLGGWETKGTGHRQQTWHVAMLPVSISISWCSRSSQTPSCAALLRSHRHRPAAAERHQGQGVLDGVCGRAGAQRRRQCARRAQLRSQVGRDPRLLLLLQLLWLGRPVVSDGSACGVMATCIVCATCCSHGPSLLTKA